MSSRNSDLCDLAKLFLKLGFLGFGGPAAHIAMMEEEVVIRRQWMTKQQFLDAVGAANLIPGPTSTELALHVGFLRGGLVGMTVAGVCFITPAACIVATLAWAYVRFGQIPEVGGMLRGIHAAVLAVIASAGLRLGRTAAKNAAVIALGILATVAAAFGANEALALVAAGTIAMLLVKLRPAHTAAPLAAGAMLLSAPQRVVGAASAQGASAAAVAGTAALGSVSISALWWYFLKIGFTVLGSGYVLIAYLEDDLVTQWRVLTRQQLLDAVAVGQITPGPLFTTATFIGFLLQGWSGALAATVAIFLPSFLFVGIASRWIHRVRESRYASAFLDAVNAGAVGLIALVSVRLGMSVLTAWPAWVICGASLAALMLTRVSSVWLVAGGGLAGWLLGYS